MNADTPAEAPRWLGRSDALQPFVATICTIGEFSDLLTRFDAELGDLQIREHRPLAENAGDVVIECNPAEACSHLQSKQDVGADDIFRAGGYFL
jgi:hypothetical protein